MLQKKGAVVALIGRGGAGKDEMATRAVAVMRKGAGDTTSVSNAVRLRAAADRVLRDQIAKVEVGSLWPDNIVFEGLKYAFQTRLYQPGLRVLYLTGGPRSADQLHWMKKTLVRRMGVELILVDLQVTPEVAAVRRQMRAQEWLESGKTPRQEDVDDAVAAVREKEWVDHHNSILDKAAELGVSIIQLDTSTLSKQHACAELLRRLCEGRVLHHDHLLPALVDDLNHNHSAGHHPAVTVLA